MSHQFRQQTPESGDADTRRHLSPQVRSILEQFRLETVVSHLLRRAHFAAEELFAQEFAEEGTTPRQKAALIIAYQNPGVHQNGLAKRLHMDRNTVAELVRRLVAARMLRRERAQDDQRAYGLFIAPAGLALLDRIMPADMALEDRLLRRLSPEDRAIFIKCLKSMVGSESRSGSQEP